MICKKLGGRGANALKNLQLVCMWGGGRPNDLYICCKAPIKTFLNPNYTAYPMIYTPNLTLLVPAYQYFVAEL